MLPTQLRVPEKLEKVCSERLAVATAIMGPVLIVLSNRRCKHYVASAINSNALELKEKNLFLLFRTVRGQPIVERFSSHS